MIIPTLFYLAISLQKELHSSIQNITSRDSLQQHSTSLVASVSSCACPQLRSTWDILWSCLATVFACTWVSTHPNCPGKDERPWRVTARRVELMIWSILVPEMIIFWALRQWLGARHLARYYKPFGWTITHGHFLQMGGLMLVDGEKDLEILTHDRFRDLLKEGTIQFPQISKEDIDALSKGDGLSKTIVVVQTLWFIAQCISRSVEGLVITEIELVTLAFAFLNGLMYFLWWNKPLNVTSVVRVPMTSTRNPVRLPLTSSTATFIFPYLSISIEDMSQSLGIHQLSNLPQNADQGAPFGVQGLDPLNNEEEPLDLDEVDKEIALDVKDLETGDAHLSGERGVPTTSSVVNINNNAKGIDEITRIPMPALQQPENTCPPETIRLNRAPSIHVSGFVCPPHEYHISAAGSKATPARLLRLFEWIQDAAKLIWRRMDEMQGVSTLEPGAKRVPTFYATIKINTIRGLLHTLIISCIGVGFGAIHCAGWNFVFRTPRERIIWRVSSAIITVFPFVLIFYVLLVYRFVKRIWVRKIPRGITYQAVKVGIYVWYIFVRCLPIYLVARIILLLEALFALGNLPDGAFAQVEWSHFVPHI